MPQTLHFYTVDSGTRRPNHEPLLIFRPNQPQYFALGGVKQQSPA